MKVRLTLDGLRIQNTSKIDGAAMEELITAIGSELDKLGRSEYRVSEDVPVGEKQLKKLRSLYSKLNSVGSSAISDFARCVNDVASPNSRISQLVVLLHQREEQIKRVNRSKGSGLNGT